MHRGENEREKESWRMLLDINRQYRKVWPWCLKGKKKMSALSLFQQGKKEKSFPLFVVVSQFAS